MESHLIIDILNVHNSLIIMHHYLIIMIVNTIFTKIYGIILKIIKIT